MNNILIYSTDYHLGLIKFIPGVLVAKFRIGYKKQSLFNRLFELITTIINLLVRHPSCNIYISRFASKDNWIVYSIFRKRCILISDGISDFLDELNVFEVASFHLGFNEPVDKRFHVKNIEFRSRFISYDEDGPIAIYNKRGRDPDYISDYVKEHGIENAIVNPLSGKFSHIYAAPSTVIFELPNEMRPHVSIVSQAHCDCLNIKRRKLLSSYESAFFQLGYHIL